MPTLFQNTGHWLEAKSNIARSGATVSNYFNTFPIFLTIGSVDYRAQLVKDSLEVDEVTTTQGSQATFTVYGLPYQKPSIGSDVSISYSTKPNVIFAGQIIDIVSRRVNRGLTFSTVLGTPTGEAGEAEAGEGEAGGPGSGLQSKNLFFYDCTCVNYINLLGRLLVTQTYQNMRVRDIISDIVDNYAPGFTLQTIPAIDDAEEVIVYLYVDHLSVVDAITNLCNAAYLFWTVGYDKQIHVKTKEFTPSNLALTDGYYTFDDLEVEEDMTQVRNRVYVRGASNLNGTNVVDTLPNSTGLLTQHFTLIYKPINPQDVTLPIQITANGVPANVGIEGIDDDAGNTLMYHYDNKAVRYAVGATVIPAGQAIVATYQYYVPTLVVVENQTAQEYAYVLEGNDNTFPTPPSFTGTSTGGNNAFEINDTTQNWRRNSLVDAVVTITGGTGSGQSASIASNTETQLRLQTALGVVPDNTSTYSISGSSVSGRSIHEGLVDDSSIEDLDTAIARGKAELSQFAYPAVRGYFMTHCYNFNLGDFLTINLSDRPPVQVFIYEKKYSMRAKEKFLIEIDFTDLQNDLYIDLMQSFIKATKQSPAQRIVDAETTQPIIVDNF